MMRFCYVGILISTMSCFEFFFGSRLYVSKLFVIYIYIYIVGSMFGLFYFGGWMNQIAYPVYHLQNVGLQVG